MSRPFTLLNVRKQLIYINEVIELTQRHGLCPAAVDEFKKIHFINRAILRRADERRANRNRKDIYVESK